MTTGMEERSQRIEDKLTMALSPSILNIDDESAGHHGHAAAATGLGYFAVTIGSPAFTEKNLLACHRLVYEALGDMMQTDIHALRIIVKR